MSNLCLVVFYLFMFINILSAQKELVPLDPSFYIPREIMKSFSPLLPHVSRSYAEEYRDKKIKLYVDYVARKELFFKRAPLNIFSDHNYKDVPSEELKKKLNKQYNQLITDPLFFLKFFNFDINDIENINSYIPKEMLEKLSIEKISLVVQDEEKKLEIPLVIVYPGENEQDNKLVLVDYSIGLKENRVFQIIFKNIVKIYPHFLRIIFKKQWLIKKSDFDVSENDIYFNLNKKRIIQDDGLSTVFYLEKPFDFYKENVEDFSFDVIRTKDTYAMPLWFKMSSSQIEQIIDKLYVNECCDIFGTFNISVLQYTLTMYSREKVLSKREELLKKVKVLVRAGARIDLQSGCGENVLHVAVLLGDEDIIRILSGGIGFNRALKQYTNKGTPLYYAHKYNNKDNIIELLQVVTKSTYLKKLEEVQNMENRFKMALKIGLPMLILFYLYKRGTLNFILESIKNKIKARSFFH